MTDKQTEALKLALEALEAVRFTGDIVIVVTVEHGPVYIDRPIAAIREALAEQPAQQEVDWEKLYRLEVKKKEALAAKYERDTGKKLTRIVPMAEQPAQQQEPVGHGGRPMTLRECMEAEEPAQQQEPVIDKSAAIRIATALGWEPRREWVGLTYGEVLEQKKDDPIQFYRAIEAKLREKNA